MHLDDSFGVLIGNICQRDIVAHKEGKTCIVVLEIDSLAHTLWILVDEAEDTFIVAAFLLIHKIRIKIKADIFAFALFNIEMKLCFVSLHHDVEIIVVGIELIIEYVLDAVRVYREQNVACKDARLFAVAALVDRDNLCAHVFLLV